MKLDKMPLTDRLIIRIRDSILAGKIPPRTRVVEQEIASDYDVSRTVVREAMRALEAQGLLVSKPYKGMEVVSLSTEEVEDLLLPLRVKVECFAFQKAIDNLPDTYFSKFDDVLEEMAIAVADKDVIAFNQADIAFHGLLLEAADSDMIKNVWKSIQLPTMLHFAVQTGRTKHLLDQFLQDHYDLLAELKKKDIRAGFSAIEKHIIETNKPHLRLLG